MGEIIISFIMGGVVGVLSTCLIMVRRDDEDD